MNNTSHSINEELLTQETRAYIFYLGVMMAIMGHVGFMAWMITSL